MRPVHTDVSAAREPLTGDDSPDDLWLRMVDAARANDQVMASVYFRRWCALATVVIDQVCDLLLEQHER